MSTVEDFETVAVPSRVTEERKSEDIDKSEMANGSLKDSKDRSEEKGGGRSPSTGGRGYRSSRGGYRGSYRGRRGSGMPMNTKYLDVKAMYLQFEDQINSITANEILDYGREAVSVGFGRGCTLHFDTPEEAKEMMEKIKNHTFCGLEAKVEYAYKKKTADPEKRTSGGDERDSSPTKKAKVDTKEGVPKEKDEIEDSVRKGVEGDGEEEPVAEGEGDEEMEGEDDVEAEEEQSEGDYGDEPHDENEEEYDDDAENPEENDDDVDADDE
ncbi:hypothetical protein SK128_004576 [Halocaridina rubra]|uniref:RRM domain-containing protein n=1 Tax=Halocaridina rubra TaxID=373956 RepID=A0AAN8X0K2_HALRR